MADKRGGNKLISGGVGFAAAFGARKILIFAWTKITGKEPPEHPEDPQVALGEALTWGILLGVGVQVARMLALRAASKRISGPEDTPEWSGSATRIRAAGVPSLSRVIAKDRSRLLFKIRYAV